MEFRGQQTLRRLVVVVALANLLRALLMVESAWLEWISIATACLLIVEAVARITLGVSLLGLPPRLHVWLGWVAILFGMLSVQFVRLL